MSESSISPAHISPGHLDRIKHAAMRGIGASPGDTLALIGDLCRLPLDPFSIESASQAALVAENERLRVLLTEKVVTSTMLTGLVPDDGGMTLGFEGGACGMLAQVFGDQFYESGAVNYLELRFDSATRPELGPLVVTLQRVEGKTPHQLREVAEDQVRTLTEQVAVLQGGQ